jgi:hypothetical protein
MMVAILIAFPLLMLGTLIYVSLAAHDETAIGATSSGQTGCVACARKRSSSNESEHPVEMSKSASFADEFVAA